MPQAGVKQETQVTRFALGRGLLWQHRRTGGGGKTVIEG